MNLHILGNDVVDDTRVLKITRSLVTSGLFEKVGIAGLGGGVGSASLELEGRHIWRPELKSRGLPRNIPSQAVKFAEWRSRILGRYSKAPVSVVHCHDLIPLPIAAAIARRTGAKLVYDAHELQSEMSGLTPLRKRLARRLEARYLGVVDAMITVSPSIRSWYQPLLPTTPIALVRNVPHPVKDEADPVDLRTDLRVPEDAILFLYLGGFSPGRGIRVMLKAFGSEGVPHHVLFMGSGRLEPEVRAAAASSKNIHWRAPVPPAEVVRHAAGADVGLIMTEDTCLNHRYALPNKLFESLVAGLPVLCSNMPDQSEIVRAVEGGWLTEPRVEPLVAQLRSLTREAVAAVAADLPDRTHHLTWEQESQALLDLYRDLLAR